MKQLYYSFLPLSCFITVTKSIVTAFLGPAQTEQDLQELDCCYCICFMKLIETLKEKKKKKRKGLIHSCRLFFIQLSWLVWNKLTETEGENETVLPTGPKQTPAVI